MDAHQQPAGQGPQGPRVSNLGSLLDGAPTGALVLDAASLCILDANAAARRLLDLPDDVSELSFGDIVTTPPARHAKALLRRLREGLVDHLILETQRREATHRSRPIEIRLSYAADPSPRFLALVLDVVERSEPDDLALRRERLRDALAEILRAITRIDDRQELYRDACRIAVERGGFRMAWIGLVDAATGDVVPVASAGYVDGYLDDLRLSTRNDPRGPGMTVTALTTLEPVAVADPRSDPMFRTLKAEVMKRGYESAVALPLVVEGRAIGALTVYASVVNAFGAIEVELLQHLADDISFKLEVIGREETRRAAEAERDRLAAVVEQSGESVVITDRDFRIVYTNAAFTNLTGFDMKDALGRRADFLRSEADSDDRSAAAEAAIADGQSWVGSARDRCKDGRERDMHFVVAPLRDGAGAILGAIVIGRDVSRERSLEAQLQQSQKLEAVGRLAGGIAHDFNNLLTAISGYAEILKSELSADDPRVGDVSEIQRAAARATQLTGQLLAFSRRQILRPRALDPASVVTGVAPMLRRLIGEDVEVVIKAGRDVGRIMADPNQLDQVLVNLALNARDAMPMGGKLEIEVDEVDLDEASAAAHQWVCAGPHVVFRVSDTGGGMTPDVMAHAFEPFFTTKPQGKGTGLGLSTVLGIVEQSNGHVTVKSSPGEGSTFFVYLPRIDAAATEEAAPIGNTADDHEAGELLVVEDEEPVRALLVRILERAGYVVHAAASAEEALRMEAAHDGRIDLLFTDVVLPGMSGRQLAERLRASRPDMPVMYASGYDQDIVATRGVLETGISYLPKPYTADQALSRIREAIRSGAPSPGA